MQLNFCMSHCTCLGEELRYDYVVKSNTNYDTANESGIEINCVQDNGYLTLPGNHFTTGYNEVVKAVYI